AGWFGHWRVHICKTPRRSQLKPINQKTGSPQKSAEGTKIETANTFGPVTDFHLGSFVLFAPLRGYSFGAHSHFHRTLSLTDPVPVTPGMQLRRDRGIRCSQFVRLSLCNNCAHVG